MKRLLIFFLTIINFSQLYSQNGEIRYKIKSSKDFKSINEQTKRVLEEINRQYLILKFDESSSYSVKEKSIPIYKFEYNIASILSKINEEWYQSAKKREAYNLVSIKNKDYVVNYRQKTKNWELFDETKNIDGYKCYKATRIDSLKRKGKIMNIEAWFTPDIPVPYGPVGNGGLPGLIMQLNRGNKFIYTADKIILNKKNIKINKLTASDTISPKKMVWMKRQVRKYTPD